MKIYFLLLIFLLFSPQLSSKYNTKKIDEKKRELFDLGKKILKEHEVINKINEKEMDLLMQIEKIDQSLIYQEQKIRDFRKEQQQLKSLIEIQESEIEQYKNYLNKYTKHVKNKLLLLYKITKNNTPAYFISYNNYNEFIRNNKIMEKILKLDMHFVEFFNTKLSIYINKRNELEKKRTYLEEMNTQEHYKSTEIETSKRAKEILLASIRAQKQGHLTLLNEYEIASMKLNDMLKSFFENSETGNFRFIDISSFRKKLKFPVIGYIETPFGKTKDEKYKTEIYSKGIDIRAALGTPVYSVFFGRVVFSRWFHGYGNLVIVNHGYGYYSLYGHLSEIAKNVGEWVENEDILGYVGETGSYKGSYLYFELRKNTQPIDPADWFISTGRKK